MFLNEGEGYFQTLLLHKNSFTFFQIESNVLVLFQCGQQFYCYTAINILLQLFLTKSTTKRMLKIQSNIKLSDRYVTATQYECSLWTVRHE